MKVAAWLSRHKPTAEQRAALEAAGYRVAQVTGGKARFMDAQDAWLMTLCQAGRPDLVIVIMPRRMQIALARKIAPIPVLRPIVSHTTGAPTWTGWWQRVSDGKQLESCKIDGA